MALALRGGGREAAPQEPGAAVQLLDEAAESEAEARRAAQKALRTRIEAEQASKQRLAAERDAKEREEAAKRCEERAETMRSEADRLRLEAERLSREAEQAQHRSRAAEREVQKWRESEVKLNSDAQELQVVAVAAAARAKISVEVAAAAAAEDLFGRPVEGAELAALTAHPAEELYEYPGREEAAHADLVLPRTGHNCDGPGGSIRVSGIRSTWGTGNAMPEVASKPAGKDSLIESVDERLAVALLQGLLRGAGPPAGAGRAPGRLPEALLREAAACFRGRDGDSFRAVLGRLCSCSGVKADVTVGVELLRSSLSKALGALIEDDRDSAREFIHQAFPQDVLLAGEELLEQLEQQSAEQAIMEYRQLAQQQAPAPRPRPPPARRTAEMHRKLDPSVLSVVQVADGADGWDMDEKALFLNHVDVLCGTKDALEDHLNQGRLTGSQF